MGSVRQAPPSIAIEKAMAMQAAKLAREWGLSGNLEEKQHIPPQATWESFSTEQGKLSIGCLQEINSFLSIWSHSGSLIIDCRSQNQTLDIRLRLPDKVWMMEYKMEFPFREISALVAVELTGNRCCVLLELRERPPHLYCRRFVDHLISTGDPYVDMIENYLASDNMPERMDAQWSWVRTTDFTRNVIGQSFAYLVEVPETNAASLQTFLNQTGMYSPISRKLWVNVGQAYATSQLVVPLLNPHTIRVQFDHLYKINNLVQHRKLCGPSLNDKFFKLVKESYPPAATFALQALSRLDSMCDDPMKFLKEQVDVFKRLQPPVAKLEKGTAWIHRILVTPTKIYCLGPEAETSNRIIRQYETLSSHFLRLNFVDEDFSPLTSTALVSEMHTSRSNVFKRIRYILKEGIFIGNRNYEFLAFSASQLREGQLWMYAQRDDETPSADEIRAGMGDFSQIRNVAKCAARMGQCFSSSRETRKVLPIQVKRIKDITVKTGSIRYCFSDGIGKISEEFAKIIAADCGLPPGCVPSAFQIRYGGDKGVVARDPTASNSFKLYLRPSMHKFDSPHMSLEVLEWTKPLPCHLNRQVICLLSTLGVKDSAFLNMQSQMVSKFECILRDNAVAIEILQELGSDSLLLKMLEAGYTSETEPLLKKLLSALKDSQLHELKSKAKIPVSKGRLMMGCLDETNTLNYGEVFIKYSAASKTGHLREEHVVTERVFVAKNPCLHPGDIRILQAVDVPELGHMVDCVVFPQSGPRPHANECSGSDLDGDLYMVVWEESLLPPTMDPPMDYSPPPPTLLDHPVEVEEIQEFFVNYMVNDNLGVIANAHVVHADKEPEKARNRKCLELAELASMAVDFPKTGVPAVIPIALRPREYPDFMEKDHKTTYMSYGILGKLYRSITISTPPQVSLTTADIKKCYDEDLMVPDYEKYVESALACKKLYDMKLIALMNHFGIKEEAEIISGHILSMSQLYVKRQADALPKVHLAFNILRKEVRSLFKRGQVEQLEEFAKASAWYYVTYCSTFFSEEENTQYLKVTRRRIYLWSFPWVVSDILFTIKNKSRLYRHPSSLSPACKSNLQQPQ